MRLAHRVKDLDELPPDLANVPSILKVKNWYAQSFEELVSFPTPRLPESIQRRFNKAQFEAVSREDLESTPNPSLQANALLEDGISKLHLTRQNRGNERRRPIIHYGTQAKMDGLEWPRELIEYNENFTRCLERIKHRHDAVVTTLAQGVLDYKRLTRNMSEQVDLQLFLDRFYMSRIGIRMLIGQHIALGRSCMVPKKGSLGYLAQRAARGALSDVSGSEPEEYVGVICTNTNIGAVAHEAIENARFICEEHYGLFKAPPVQLVCPKDLTFMYVPSHLNHMLFELLKNSLRAVVERFGMENEDEYPPIKVIVVEGNEDITIKISDEGGGIPRSEVPLAWTYMYTTARSEELDPDFQSSDFQAPMAGFGYGLPLARLVRDVTYAVCALLWWRSQTHLHGRVRLCSHPSYGTDVYLHLNRLSSSSEPLP